MSSQTLQPDRVPEAPLVAPGDQGGLHNVFRQRYLLKLLVGKELAARYQGSVLGLFWSYVQPAVKFTAYYFVMGYIFQLHRDIEHFEFHLFAGMVMVHYFTETFSAGTRSIVRNKRIIQKLPLPRELFPVASMLVSAYHTVPQMVLLLIGVLVVGWDPSLYDLSAGILGFAIVATYGVALALIFSAANVYFRDFQNIVATFTIFVTWSVPMIYPYDRIEKLFGGTWIEQVYLMNPIADGVLLMQQLFWVPTVGPESPYPVVMPDYLMTRGVIVLVACGIMLVFAQKFFTRLEGKFVERL
ncbi:MAG TPA: ABC transporter permease [Nocardioidaceae bacterium]|nr:ABC transporter permease [Nocardioidaceae bacterium]